MTTQEISTRKRSRGSPSLEHSEGDISSDSDAPVPPIRRRRRLNPSKTSELPADSPTNAKALASSTIQKRKKNNNNDNDNNDDGDTDSIEEKQRAEEASRKFPCPQNAAGCDKMFKTKWKAKAHSVIHTNVEERRIHICSHCGKGYDRRYRLIEHINKEHADNPTLYTCEVCGHTTHCMDHLKKHCQTHEGTIEDRRKIPCRTCGLKFVNRESIKIHMKVHDGGRKTHRCPDAENQCRRLFDTLEQAKAHAAREHFNDAKICPYMDCKKGPFGHTSLLIEHINSAHKKEKVACPYCEKECTRQGLGDHIQVEHAKGQSRFPCLWPNCKVVRKRRIDIRSHIKLHHQKIGYHCPMRKEYNCNRLFGQPSQATLHAECAHLGIRNYVCEQCGRRYFREDHLKVHLERSHGGSNFFKCVVSMCPRAVSGRPFHSSTIKNHMALHEKLGHLEGLDPSPEPELLIGDLTVQKSRGAFKNLDAMDKELENVEADEGLRTEIFDDKLSGSPDQEASGNADNEDFDNDENVEDVEDVEDDTDDEDHPDDIGYTENQDDTEDENEDYLCDDEGIYGLEAGEEFSEIGAEVDVTRERVAERNQGIRNSGCVMTEVTRGYKCVGPRPWENGLVTELCPHDITIDYDTALIVQAGRKVPHLSNKCVSCHYAYKVTMSIRNRGCEKESNQTRCSHKICQQKVWRTAKFCKEHYDGHSMSAPNIKIPKMQNVIKHALQMKWEGNPEMDKVAELMAARLADPKRPDNIMFLDLETSLNEGKICEIAICNAVGKRVLECHPLMTPAEEKKLRALFWRAERTSVYPKYVLRASNQKKLGHACSDGFLNVHQVAKKLRNLGVSPRSTFVAWAKTKLDLTLMRAWLEAGGYDDILPEGSGSRLEESKFLAN